MGQLGGRADFSWACSHVNRMARVPLMHGPLCSMAIHPLDWWASQAWSQGHAARSSRGRVETDEVSPGLLMGSLAVGVGFYQNKQHSRIAKSHRCG